ncbi:MAG: exodeoxyribonuclease VII large subunit [Bacteroidales bacterium]
MSEHLTLSSLNRQIREFTQQAFPQPVWVVAEILEMNLNRSGHCYMELIEKSESDNNIIAKSRATIWAFKFRMIRPYFEATTGSILQPGIKILLKAEVTFHELYGLSLNINDIDPSFTLGDMARQKQEVINRLKSSGVMEMNRELILSEVPQRIAVISSETAAGYGDFIDSLINNNFGIGFSVSLFQAIVQGDAAESSMISALEQVFESDTAFDAVVLIRGGGSQSDLDCFNGFELAMNIAQFPLPVLTGIGHERDVTIADMVAHQSLKTPTAVAEFLVDKVAGFLEKLDRIRERFSQAVRWILQEETMVLQQKASDLHYLVQQHLTEGKHGLEAYRASVESSVKHIVRDQATTLNNHSDKLKYLWKGIFSQHRYDLKNFRERNRRSGTDLLQSSKEQLRNFERTLELVRPEKVLARGYSITWSEGKAVKSVRGMKKGTPLETLVSDGKIQSVVSSDGKLSN